MSKAILRHQPAFCPVCGDSLMYSSLFGHLDRGHNLHGRARLRVLNVVWREVSCALLEITKPEWNGP